MRKVTCASTAVLSIILFPVDLLGNSFGSVTFRRCMCTRIDEQCVRSRTWQPHETLRGVSATCEFKTSKAHIYPEEFAEDLVRQISVFV